MKFIKESLLPFFVAGFYWAWSHSWRLKIIEDPELTKIKKQKRVIFCHWHGDELVVIRLGPVYHCAAMTSTSKDGELMDKVLQILGFGTSRGSSTRGGARALIGMIDLMKKGYHATMAIDGPKGPRHKPKPGAWALAKHTGSPIIPMGVARKSAFIFKRSWNKTYLPWPLTKVIVSFGAPMYANETSESDFCKSLEKQMFLERGTAQKLLLGLLLCLAITSCSTEQNAAAPASDSGAVALLSRTAHTPLRPRGHLLQGNEPTIVRYIQPNSPAAKLGFKVGDKILKINSKSIDGFLDFEKKIKNIAVITEIEYKSRNKIFTKQIKIAGGLLGLSTEPQNISLIKRTSPSIVFMNKGLHTIYCTVSKTNDGKNLFINLILDGFVTRPPLSGRLTIKTKKKGFLAKSAESVDAPSEGAVLISKKIDTPSSLDSGLLVLFAVEKEQYAFEFLP